jgi:hypothetical protein
MSFDCTQLRETVANFSLVEDCDVLPSGVLRVATPFRYPEGSNIDVFIIPEQNLFGDLIVSDLGQTVAYLADLHIYPSKTNKRRLIVSDICDALNVRNDDGQLKVSWQPSDIKVELPDAIVRVAQASLRVADLCYTQRFPSTSTFRDDVEEFISDSNVPYKTDVVLPGKYNRDITVDFQIEGRRTKTLMLLLSTANVAAGHSIANEVFRKWFDLSPYTNSHQFMTLYNSENDTFRPDDVERLSALSNVFGFPAEQKTVREAIIA